MECLVRHIAALPHRSEWLNGYERVHGAEHAEKLADLVRAEMRQAR